MKRYMRFIIFLVCRHSGNVKHPHDDIVGENSQQPPRVPDITVYTAIIVPEEVVDAVDRELTRDRTALLSHRALVRRVAGREAEGAVQIVHLVVAEPV